MYVVIGGNGYLGSYIIKSILSLTDDSVIATARNIKNLQNTERVSWKNCNILDKNEFKELVDHIKKFRNIKIIFLAAYHHPDLVNEYPGVAWNINVTALSWCINQLHFAEKLFYASTDSVYGDSVDNYHFKEYDLLNPVNTYGKNKAAAEAIIQYSGFYIVRYPFLIGPSLVNGKKHFYDMIAESLKSGREVEMFHDSYRSSLHFNTASELLVKLCELDKPLPSIINLCGDKDLSKYDIGLLIASKLGIPSSLIKPISIYENDDIFKSKRATTTLMDNQLAKKILDMAHIEFKL